MAKEENPKIASLTDRLREDPEVNLRAAASQNRAAFAAMYFQDIFGFVPSDDTGIESRGIPIEDSYLYQLLELKNAAAYNPGRLYSKELSVEGSTDTVKADVCESRILVPSSETNIAEIITCLYSLEEQQIYDIFTRSKDGRWLRSQLMAEGHHHFQQTGEINQPTAPFMDTLTDITQQIVACENPFAKAKRKYAGISDLIEEFARTSSGYSVKIDRYQVYVDPTLSTFTYAPLFE